MLRTRSSMDHGRHWCVTNQIRALPAAAKQDYITHDREVSPIVLHKSRFLYAHVMYPDAVFALIRRQTRPPDDLLSPPLRTTRSLLIPADHCSGGGSDSRMRTRASPFSALSDCWRIKPVIRIWETSTADFHWRKRALNRRWEFSLEGVKWENRVRKTLHPVTSSQRLTPQVPLPLPSSPGRIWTDWQRRVCSLHRAGRIMRLFWIKE